MNRVGSFELDIDLGDENLPARVKVVLRQVATGPNGEIAVTPECTSADGIEACINALQADLDELRARALRAFRKP